MNTDEYICKRPNTNTTDRDRERDSGRDRDIIPLSFRFSPYVKIAEDDGLFYMFEGDITYTDETLYANKISVIYEDLAAARETLDRVREFVKHNPTVYLGTHTPFGYKNLEEKRIVDLNKPPKTLPVGEIVFKTKTGKYVCSVCGYVYDPAENNGVAFEDLPEDWKCPRCRQPKTKFNAA